MAVHLNLRWETEDFHLKLIQPHRTLTISDQMHELFAPKERMTVQYYLHHGGCLHYTNRMKISLRYLK